MRGRWIALEGGEGSGKSTQAALLASSLGAVLTREPGGTAVGERIRAVLLDPASATLDDRAEALLMAADRAQHILTVVAPALAAGRDVVSDRSAWSSLAYQGYGRGLDRGWLWSLSDWAMDSLWPDLVVLVGVCAETAATRVAMRPGGLDRLELEDEGFHERVRTGFDDLAAAHREQWAAVDGEGKPEEVAQLVFDAVQARLPRR